MEAFNSHPELSETVPFQYQYGYSEFMGIRINVDPRVLIPRPETELLVRASAEILSRTEGDLKILEMCTGSGAIAVALSGLVPQARIVATDISEEALDVASDNIKKNCFGGNIKLLVSDMYKALGVGYRGSFDAIVSNPPYVSDRDFEMLDAWVRAEPKVALYAGKNGMDYLTVICEGASTYLKKGGFLAVEIGYDQCGIVREKMLENGLGGIKAVKDHNGYDRVMMGFLNG